MNKIKLLSLFALWCLCQYADAQSSTIPLGNEAYRILDRLEIKANSNMPYHSSLKSYQRREVMQFAFGIDSTLTNLTEKDRQDLQWLYNDNNEWLANSESATTLTGKREPVLKKIYTDSTKTFYTFGEATQTQATLSNEKYQSSKPILKYFYRTPANFFEYNQNYFYIKVNPILYVAAAKDSEDDELIFRNTRGVEIRGGIDDRIYFYSNIVETQQRFPNYVNDRIEKVKAIPGNGFYKTYVSDVFNITTGYDFLNSQGYLGFNVTKHIGVQFGYGKNFIGNGYRSLLLSDFSDNYLYLKLNTNIGRLHYQNIFAEMNPISTNASPTGKLIPKKYYAAHFLSFDITKNFNIGLFETVVFNRTDHFEFQYLNPIILYRTVEGSLGSPDNVLLGFNSRLNLFKHVQLYGQILLDEFVLSEIKKQSGWWANKYSLQGGIKYIDVLGIDHLDIQAEYNLVRPYTYAHAESAESYSHHNMPLAHPLGANFKEAIGILRYQPIKKLMIEGRFIVQKYGDDIDSTNWGSNILLSYKSHEQDYNNEIGQGIGADQTIIALEASYQLWHNVFIDFDYFRRNKKSQLSNFNQTTNYVGGGIRINFARQRNDF
ncbi:MAG: hypothetical protein KA974_04675 [Saprospiraceae bacterium]|nr:hypothetical protein [Saprospiraceae bacterium]MBP7699232.1 hypothetical protein [Saprospiraceae bacterium]